MRIPSYLVCNKYGKYHFRITFRLNSAPNASKNVFKRALVTNNRQLAVTLARAVKAKIDRLWNSIPLLKMNWLETKEILNRIVEDTLQEYRSVVLENGTYGAHVANYSQASLETMAERVLERITLQRYMIGIICGHFFLPV